MEIKYKSFVGDAIVNTTLLEEIPMIVENTKSGNELDGVNGLQEKTTRQTEYPTEEEAKEEINVVENYILDSWWVTH